MQLHRMTLASCLLEGVYSAAKDPATRPHPACIAICKHMQPPGRVELLGRDRGRRCVLRAPRPAMPAPRPSCAAGSGSAATERREGGCGTRAAGESLILQGAHFARSCEAGSAHDVQQSLVFEVHKSRSTHMVTAAPRKAARPPTNLDLRRPASHPRSAPLSPSLHMLRRSAVCASAPACNTGSEQAHGLA